MREVVEVLCASRIMPEEVPCTSVPPAVCGHLALEVMVPCRSSTEEVPCAFSLFNPGFRLLFSGCLSHLLLPGTHLAMSLGGAVGGGLG